MSTDLFHFFRWVTTVLYGLCIMFVTILVLKLGPDHEPILFFVFLAMCFAAIPLSLIGELCK